MAEKVICEFCNRIFKDIDGLEQHKTAKHITGINEKPMFDTKKIRNWVIFISIFILIIVGISWIVSLTISGINYCKTAPVTEINIGNHKNLKLHIHSELKIIIDGEKKLIPANIGASEGILRPVHTHDSSGEIHMEGSCERGFTIEDFFTIWEKEFNSQCIFNKCSGELKMTVNGVKNKEFENYIMKDHDNIIIEYKSTGA